MNLQTRKRLTNLENKLTEGNTERPGTASSEPLFPSWSRQERRFPCVVWNGFPAFPAHLSMRPVSRRNSRRATWVVTHAERPRFPVPPLRTGPHRWQPTRLPCPWDSPGKNNGVGCHFLLQSMKVKSESEVAQPCPTLSDPMDCSLPGSSIHGIFQARVLEWGAIAFSDS